MEKTYRRDYFKVKDNIRKPSKAELLRVIQNDDDLENVYILLQLAQINIEKKLNGNKPEFTPEEIFDMLTRSDLSHEERQELEKMMSDALEGKKPEVADDPNAIKILTDLNDELSKLVRDIISLPLEYWQDRGAAKHANNKLGYNIVPETDKERSDCVFEFINTLFCSVFFTGASEKEKQPENKSELIAALQNSIKNEKSFDIGGKR